MLKQIAPLEHRNSIPNQKVTKFLSFIEEKVPGVKENTNQIKYLKLSRDLRTKYIDHTQFEKPYDWESFSNQKGEAYIIYYRSSLSGEQVDISSYVHSSPIKIFTSRKVEEVFVTPHHSLVLIALYEIAVETLIYFNNLKE